MGGLQSGNLTFQPQPHPQKSSLLGLIATMPVTFMVPKAVEGLGSFSFSLFSFFLWSSHLLRGRLTHFPFCL